MSTQDPTVTCEECGVTLSAKGFKLHKGTQKCKIQAEKRRREAQAATDRQFISQLTVSSGFVPDLPLGNLLQNLRTSTQIVRRIPKGARKLAAQSLTERLQQIGEQNAEPMWRDLFLFAFTGLKKPENQKGKKQSLTSAIKNNLTRPELPEAKPAGKTKTAKKETADATLKKIVEGKLNDADISGTLRVLTSEDTVASPSTDVLEILRSKHPAEAEGSVFPDPPDPRIFPHDVTNDEIIAAVQSFPNGSAGGIDCLRPQHLKDMLAGPADGTTTALVENLAKLMTLIIQGKVPEAVTSIFYGASLTALKKKDGGIRPIAVGNTLRRLACKIVSKRVSKEIEAQVRPQQVGCGTKGGAEAAVHAARCFLQAESASCRVLLKIDFRNAFNTLRRDGLLDLVRQVLPDYFAFIWQSYRSPSKLVYGQHFLESASGVQQGDPLGPMLFCLVIKQLTKKLSSSFNVWYLDDGSIAGSPEEVLADLETVIVEGQKIGLDLNPTKCELFIQGGTTDERKSAKRAFSAVCPGILFPTRAELSLLGAPLLEDGLEDAIAEKTSKLNLLTKRLNLLFSHQALFLLKNCLGMPKLLYVLRCSPTWKFPAALQAFDEVLRLSVAEITNNRMDGITWHQASLPVSMGGLGIRRTERIALPAFMASIHSVLSLVLSIYPESDLESHVFEGLAHWPSLTNAQLPVATIRHQQQAWDLPMVKEEFETMLNTSDMTNRARLLAVSTKTSGVWLHALPSSNLGNLLDDNALRISVGLRLGSRLCQPHLCRCGEIVDEHGRHGLSCLKSAGRHSRHSALNESVRRALVSAQVPAVLEPPGLSRNDGKRPDGKTMIPWKLGRELIWDVTVVDTLAKSYVAKTSERAGAAAEDAEERKIQKYTDIGSQYLFVPLAFETCGSWGPAATALVEAIGKRVVDFTFESKSSQFFKQRLSIDIQRGNAFCVLGTVKDTKGLDEIFYVLNLKKGRSVSS